MLMRLVVLLPYKWQLALGRVIGRFSYKTAPLRRHITEKNLQICFPELAPSEHKQLVQKSFESMGMGLMETAMAWFMPDWRLRNKLKLQGVKYPLRALLRGERVILAGAHFTCLEIVGRLAAMQHKFNVLYREHNNALYDEIMLQCREKHFDKVISRKHMKTLIKTILQNKPVWYASDQDYGKDHSVFAPFFSTPAASITLLSRLSEKTGAKVFPVFYHRLPDGKGYEAIIHPELKNFPSNDLDDIKQFNQLLEQDLKQHPDQYLWQHRRFKTRQPGQKKIYTSKRFFR